MLQVNNKYWNINSRAALLRDGEMIDEVVDDDLEDNFLISSSIVVKPT